MRREEAGKRRGATFFGGVLVLTVANLLVKLFGFLYKVPLNALLGDEMANVNAAYSVYALLYMLSTAGIPVAVSVLVSRARAEGRPATLLRIFRVSLVSLSLLGAAGTVGLLLLADPIAIANSGGDSYLCLLAIAPALFFICLSSVMRGYFQGFGLMTPTAVSGVIEAVAKTLLGLLFVTLLLSATGSLRLASAYSVLAITVGIALGALYLGLIHGYYKKRGLLAVSGEEQASPPLRSVAKDLVAIAVPIALSSGVLSLASLIDSQMMRPLLESYYGDPALAKAVFSDYSTGAVTLFNMPTVLVYPIASAIVPYITAARARGELSEAGRYVSSALRIAALISLPAALGMSVLSAPILDIVFLGDADMAFHAASPLAILSLSIFPLGLLAVTNAVLQSFGRQGCPILSMCAGVLVKITVLLLLTP
ncbi:MAG: polysaccharide biosynthesis protein, partial [Clostridia bacterium]|nr:polysaccharide biosynthesis protein [Clostridia bacterium]